jgi:hypothetical protein
MGRVRRGGFIFEWWRGDHPPRHVHVSDRDGNLLGRIAVETMEPLDEWIPPRKALEIIQELQTKGRL